jgi:MATE family multidrug resistance protein
MIIGNITTPLLGMVDTAIVGHLGDVTLLAGASIGATIITQLYWICGFIRMSSTGLSAIAKGQQDQQSAFKVLVQSLLVGVLLGIAFLSLQKPIIEFSLVLADASDTLRESIVAYTRVRVWGAPAALANLALIGWLLGQQKMRQVLVIQILGNLINIVFDLVFVLGLQWQLEGVALASIMAEYSMCVMALMVIARHVNVRLFRLKWCSISELKPILSLNSDMLIRNIALQVCLAFLVYQGARLGTDIAAANAILMHFLVLAALGLDGIAYGAEALIGESKGKRSQQRIVYQTHIAMIWSSVMALLVAGLFAFCGSWIIALMTNLSAIQVLASEFIYLIVMLPIIGHWCFLYDGVFIGLSKAKAMRNTMLIGALAIFFPSWWLLQEYGNHGLWIAMLLFMAARGITLGGYFYFLRARNQLLD